MTEVAQVVAVIDHDMDDLAVSDGENKENETINVKEDHAEKEGSEEETEKTPHTVDDDGSNHTETTQTNGVKEESDERKDQTPKAVNGVAKDTEEKQDSQPETNEDLNMSEFDLKKEARKVFVAISDKVVCALPTIEIMPFLLYLLSETFEIQKASGQKLRSQDEQGEGGRVGQVWGDAESPGGAQQAEEQGRAAEEEGTVHQGEGVESQEAAGQREKPPLTSDWDLHGIMRHDQLRRLPMYEWEVTVHHLYHVAPGVYFTTNLNGISALIQWGSNCECAHRTWNFTYLQMDLNSQMHVALRGSILIRE